MKDKIICAAALVALCGCNPASQDATPQEHGDVASDVSDRRAYSDIAPGETLRFTGTEPFWGGQVHGERLSYSTPEDPDGTEIAVERFAGRGGLSWTGTYRGDPFTLVATPGHCNDGMSDRSYPFVATLQVEGAERRGCAWSQQHPFDGGIEDAPKPHE